MTNDMAEPHAAGEPLRSTDRWAVFRFATIGPLLAAPPASGKLREAILALAAKTWQHPIRSDAAKFPLVAARGQRQTEAPQVAVAAERTEGVLRTLHQ